MAFVLVFFVNYKFETTYKFSMELFRFVCISEEKYSFYYVLPFASNWDQTLPENLIKLDIIWLQEMHDLIRVIASMGIRYRSTLL
jgi:hypothetical protein